MVLMNLEGYLLEHEGNPENGTIYLLKQVHETPDSDENEAPRAKARGIINK
jgi:hypothetical protein